MWVDSKYLGAFFFISHDPTEGNGNEALCTYLSTAGATEISQKPAPLDWLPHTTTQQVIEAATCEWSGMYCEVELERLENHHLLDIYFFQSHFFKMIGTKRAPLPLVEDGALGLAHAFQYACEQLSPEVAFIATHTYDACPEAVLEREWMITACDADALADERLGLLYLNDEISQCWTSLPIRGERDSLPIPSGRLVFAGCGWDRWF